MQRGNPLFSLLFFFVTVLFNRFSAAISVDEPQCVDPATMPRSYVRDGPLHGRLVDDTWKALHNFADASDSQYRPRYFEGWYYKLDLPGEGGGTFVAIPGLYLRKEEQYGFVMILDATHGDAPLCRFYKFPIEKVTGDVGGDHDFAFRLDERNVFTAHNFTLDLPADEHNPAVSGSAAWAAPLPLPVTRWNPTIMGWFSWLPRGVMQCSHGVVSMDHAIACGSVQVGASKVIRLTGARGYIEKDWGKEFPEKYTWIQASDFRSNGDEEKSEIIGASFLVSVASIPVKPFESWLEFTGFLSFLRYPTGDGTFRTLRFATYTGAKVSYTYNVTTHPDNETARREDTVFVTMTSSRYELTATATGDRGGAATLWGPLPGNPSGGMRPYVREMLRCPVRVFLKRRKDGAVLFDGTARHGGFEIEGHDEEQAMG